MIDPVKLDAARWVRDHLNDHGAWDIALEIARDYAGLTQDEAQAFAWEKVEPNTMEVAR